MTKQCKCFLCDRLKPEEKMQTIIVNGNKGQKEFACADHDIKPEVMSYDFQAKPAKGVK